MAFIFLGSRPGVLPGFSPVQAMTYQLWLRLRLRPSAISGSSAETLLLCMYSVFHNPLIHTYSANLHTGCSLNIVFFSKILKYSGFCFSLFSLVVSVCTRQVEHQRCSNTGRVQKNSKILRKNTIINEHPVQRAWKAIRGNEGESLKDRDLKNK